MDLDDTPEEQHGSRSPQTAYDGADRLAGGEGRGGEGGPEQDE
jgi:hypothetical protein